MKKLIAICALFLSALSFGQAITESFDDLKDASSTSTTAPLETRGWSVVNNSTLIGTTGWFGNGTAFASHTGAGYIGANFENISGTGTISNWLISPVATFQNGDTITYWTRTNTAGHPDRLELRLSTNGSSTNVGTTDSSVGDFTTVLDTVNSSLVTGSANYPTTWTLRSVTITGLSGTVSGRFAFRYFVTTAGSGAANGEYIGLDDVSYTPNPNKTVTGTLTLSGYTGSVSTLQFIYELRDSSTNALIESQTITGLGAGNTFSFTTTQAAGTYKLRIKGVNRFLAKSQSLTLSSTGATGLTYTLGNGDCDGSNIVGTPDFNVLRAAWGATPSDTNWNAAADLNGDGIIGTADFNIMRSNWGALGDD